MKKNNKPPKDESMIQSKAIEILKEKYDLKLVDYIDTFIDDNQYEIIDGKITSLKIEKMKIERSDLEMIATLSDLIYLDLSDNSITDISVLDGMRSIIHLYLSNNSITDISALEGMRSIIHLDLSNNSITDISALEGMRSITNLILSHNSITDISALEGMRSITYLYLYNNSITDISALEGMRSITNLILSHNSITDISALEGMRSITHLYLYNNSITDISALEGMRSITNLYLYNNSITDISVLEGMRSITHLDLSNNSITDISALEGMRSITKLDLSENSITDISALEGMSKLEYFYIENNPIVEDIDISELQNLSAKAKIEYIIAAKSSGTVVLNEFKLLVVGDERVGKSSTINRVVDRAYSTNQSTTEGIDICNHLLKDEIKVNIWDFAGQELTHHVHHYFLSSRSLYMLLLDAQEMDSESKIEYWLETIKTYAKDSPIIVVVNKIDKNSTYKFDLHRFEKEYNIVALHYISAEENTNIDTLKESIYSIASAQESVKKSIPKSYMMIKEWFEEQKKSVDILPKHEFEAKCKKECIDKAAQESILELLHEIGTIVCFYATKSLKDLHILNPKWITNGVYKIIRDSKIDGDGKFCKDDYSALFKDSANYNLEYFDWFCTLLIRYEVAFEVDEDTILIPSRLESVEPEYDEYRGGLNFVYDYDKNLIKKSIISQFIVKMSKFVDDRLDTKYWQNGVFLSYQNSLATVTIDVPKKILSISINTYDKSGRELLTLIRDKIDDIHKDKYSPSQMIPLKLMGSDEILGRVDYDYMLQLEQNNIPQIPLRTYDKKLCIFDVSYLLDGYKKDVAKIENLYHDIIAISKILTQRNIAIQSEKEDNTNDRYKDMLSMKGYIANDQARGGISRVDAGERDIVVYDPRDSTPVAILEGLQDLSKKSIIDHYERVTQKYNTTQDAALYMLVYVKSGNYENIYKNYIKYLSITDIVEDSTNIRVAKSKYKSTTVYHIVINFIP
jgi:small GTP-binding protein